MRTGLDRKFWNAIEKIKHLFSLGAKHNVCNGPATRFWLDWWQGRGPLRDRFLGLFAIVADPEATVAEIFQDNTFRVTFRRELGFGERVEWDNLSRLVEGLTLSEPRDLISWSLEPSGSFSVRSLYKRMCQGIPHKHFGVLWGINAPLEVRIFLWQLAEKRLQSNENIRKRRALPMGVVPCVGRWKTTSTFSSAAH
jgi:hypothetical protein